jgi:putative endonuclease
MALSRESKHKSPTSQKGAVGEEIACRYLVGKGYSVIEQNYRKPWGEIDVIAVRGNIVHFIEVKAVTRSLDGSREPLSREIDYRPEEMATASKLHRVARTASLYMESKKDGREYQIDVLGVIMDPERRMARCRFFAQALGD